MESRAFIKSAAVLIEKIETSHGTVGTPDDLRSQREGIQRDISSVMTGSLNPTLPSAFRLRDVALRAGYSISPAVLQRLAAFDNWSA